ncbi:MAG: hypothetical protein GY856_49775 [bacterium]|nr:hypothetical protein [bacterium]
MKKRVKRLQLNRETLYTLADQEVKDAMGGIFTHLCPIPSHDGCGGGGTIKCYSITDCACTE